MIDTLSNKQIESLLKNQIIARIGCYADGETYVFPISYAYDGEYIYCHTTEGKKTDMLRKNPELCFQTDSIKSLADWKSVIVHGKYEELTDVESRDKAFHILLNRKLPIVSGETMHLGEDWPFHTTETKEIEGVFFRIVISKKTGRFELEPASPPIPG